MQPNTHYRIVIEEVWCHFACRNFHVWDYIFPYH